MQIRTAHNVNGLRSADKQTAYAILKTLCPVLHSCPLTSVMAFPPIISLHVREKQ